jgi:hypothetical protein
MISVFIPLHNLKNKGHVGCWVHVCCFCQNIGEMFVLLPIIPSDIQLLDLASHLPSCHCNLLRSAKSPLKHKGQAWTICKRRRPSHLQVGIANVLSLSQPLPKPLGLEVRASRCLLMSLTRPFIYPGPKLLWKTQEPKVCLLFCWSLV